MLEKAAITAGALALGLVLAWAFDRIARPAKRPMLLIPLVLPGLLWFGISGQLSEVKGPGGFQLVFAAAARAPVADFTDRGGLGPIFPTAPTTAQMALPAEARYVKEALEGASVAVLRGDVTRRIFYWIVWDGLEPRQLLARIDSVRDAAGDAVPEYLLFGPAVGVIDCYILDVDFERRHEALAKTLTALAAMPAAQQRAFLPEQAICRRPMPADVPALAALRRLDAAGHDEGIVVNAAQGYVGITFRDTIVSALVSALFDAIAGPESAAGTASVAR